MATKTVLSLFDGISCGQMALNRVGIKINKYYASEIDKHAIKATLHNFPNTIQLGDVRNVNVSDLEPIDILMGGSPCTDFSFAGKRKGMSTTENIEIKTLSHYLELKNQEFSFEGQSYLFWEYMRILIDIRKYNPNVLFFLENVQMTEKWKKVLTTSIGINPILINSALLSAQNRERLYWTNIGSEPDGLFGYLACKIPQPKDKKIYLKDILEENVADKYYLSDKMIEYFNNRAANFNQGKVNIRNENDKATTLTKSMSSCDISDNFIVASRGRNPESGLNTKQMLEPRLDGKTNCLTDGKAVTLKSEGGGGGAKTGLYLVGNIDSGYESNGRVYSSDGKSKTLNAGNGGGGEAGQRTGIYLHENSIRRLTPVECCRLQTVPDDYFYDSQGKDIISDTQKYRCLGNGWTVDVIAYIFSYINNKNE